MYIHSETKSPIQSFISNKCILSNYIRTYILYEYMGNITSYTSGCGTFMSQINRDTPTKECNKMFIIHYHSSVVSLLKHIDSN